MTAAVVIPLDRACYRILNPAGFNGPDDHLYAEGDIITFHVGHGIMRDYRVAAVDERTALVVRVDV